MSVQNNYWRRQPPKLEPDRRFTFLQSFFQRGHFDCRDGSLYAFIPMFASGAIEFLLFIIGGHDTEETRDICGQAEHNQGLCHGIVNVFVVPGLARNDASKANDSIERLASEQEFGPEG